MPPAPMPGAGGIIGGATCATRRLASEADRATIAIDADGTLRLMSKPGEACSSLVYLGRFQNNIEIITLILSRRICAEGFMR